MNEILILYFKSITTLFLVIDPVGIIPVYMALTKGMTVKDRKNLLNKSIIVAFILLGVFTIAGSGILWLFGIDVHDFRVAGGLLFLLISIQIIFGNNDAEYSEKISGIVPFATPIMVGPGVVTATIVLTGTVGVIPTLVSGIIAFLLTYIILYFGRQILELLGQNVTDVITKVIGLILAAISIHYIREGILGIIKHSAG
ncbi:MarC family protein [Deferribacter thermophilus]|uniref:MarC family protein n=1 Tax=Deferribacter thermophilus TaxID=53573 RepID=UPI003C1D2C4E